MDAYSQDELDRLATTARQFLGEVVWILMGFGRGLQNRFASGLSGCGRALKAYGVIALRRMPKLSARQARLR